MHGLGHTHTSVSVSVTTANSMETRHAEELNEALHRLKSTKASRNTEILLEMILCGGSQALEQTVKSDAAGVEGIEDSSR